MDQAESAGPLLEVVDLSVRYPDTASNALENVSLSVAGGELVLLTGASGCGKSTFLSAVRGVLPHLFPADVSGHLRVNGLSVQETSVSVLAEHVGLVLQEPAAQLCNLTVRTEVAFGVENLELHRDECLKRIDRALDAVSLSGKGEASIDALSGGECQRLAVASVLAMSPCLLLLDEPTATLDSSAAAEIVQIAVSLKAAGHAVIVVQHDFDELLPYADRMVVFDRGTIYVEGRPREVVARLLDDPARPVAVPAVSNLAHSIGLPTSAGSCPLTPEELVAVLPRPVGGVAEVATEGAPPGIARSAPFVVAENVGFRYPRQPDVAVRDVSLTLTAGEAVALVGRNGSGKSTLARMLVGLLVPDQGTVSIGGEQVRRLRHRSVQRDTGYVFQFPEHQFVTQTVRDEIAYGLHCRGEDQGTIDETVAQAAERLGLLDKLDRHPFTLSGGEKRRLSVATMLVLKPRVLVLDEPTYGLDEANMDALVGLIFSELRAAGATIIVITHDMSLVAEHADCVVAMSGGRSLFCGTPGEFFDSGVLARIDLLPPPLARVRGLARERGIHLPRNATTIPTMASALRGQTAKSEGCSA